MPCPYRNAGYLVLKPHRNARASFLILHRYARVRFRFWCHIADRIAGESVPRSQCCATLGQRVRGHRASGPTVVISLFHVIRCLRVLRDATHYPFVWWCLIGCILLSLLLLLYLYPSFRNKPLVLWDCTFRPKGSKFESHCDHRPWEVLFKDSIGSMQTLLFDSGKWLGDHDWCNGWIRRVPIKSWILLHML